MHVFLYNFRFIIIIICYIDNFLNISYPKVEYYNISRRRTLVLSTWFWIFLIIFIAGMSVVIVVATKRTKTIDDFAISGATLGPVVLGLSFAATVMSAATFMGYPG